MRLTVLGSGTLVPDPVRGAPGFLLEAAGKRFLVDGGNGTLQKLVSLGHDPMLLDGGIFSHLHVDHCSDILPLLHLFRSRPVNPREREYPIWAGAGFRQWLDQLLAAMGWSLEQKGFDVPITELPLDAPGRALLPGGTILETRPANHSRSALHLRFTEPGGGCLVFSGDTGPSAGLVQLSRGAHMLVCECALSPGSTFSGHMNPSQVAELVGEARPGRVLLTHLHPGTGPSGAAGIVGATGVPTDLAADGQKVEITSTWRGIPAR